MHIPGPYRPGIICLRIRSTDIVSPVAKPAVIWLVHERVEQVRILTTTSVLFRLNRSCAVKCSAIQVMLEVRHNVSSCSQHFKHGLHSNLLATLGVK